MLQRTLQWQQDDTPEQRLAKLEQELSQYRLPLEDSVPLFAALLSLPIPEDRYPPLRLSPQRQRQKTLESIVAILLEQAERQPVLFILEDLHWLDPTSLELLDLLLEQTPTTSVLTLLTCRPNFQPTWSGRSYLTQMTLNRLSRNSMSEPCKRSCTAWLRQNWYIREDCLHRLPIPLSMHSSRTQLISHCSRVHDNNTISGLRMC